MNIAYKIQINPYDFILKTAVHKIKTTLRKRNINRLVIYTSQYRYKGEDRVDITVKTGNKNFAPTWDMVWGLKKNTISKDYYSELYIERMKQSIIKNPSLWIDLLSRGRVVLVCFCRSGAFCHRILLANLLVELFDAWYCGEIHY